MTTHEQSAARDYGEPWKTAAGKTVYNRTDNFVAEFSGYAATKNEGHRAVACVNALAGLTDEELANLPAMLEYLREVHEGGRGYDMSAGYVIGRALSILRGNKA